MLLVTLKYATSALTPSVTMPPGCRRREARPPPACWAAGASRLFSAPTAITAVHAAGNGSRTALSPTVAAVVLVGS